MNNAEKNSNSPQITLKKCSKCRNEKPLTEFRNDKYAKYGKTPRCKTCLATFKPKEIRCFNCQEWFTPKRGNCKFCTPYCHNYHWSKVWSLSTKGRIYQMEYQRNYIRRDRYTSTLHYE